ncbi:MAG TPA: M20/M25/M40 family metallo-hydrolase, partial [Longimicrobiales bacterium]|nr:M20/M25/M40 family metallo-hydrolase [Longimicrobiales bacterium]
DVARMVLRGPTGARALRPPDFYAPGGALSSFRDFGGALLYAGATPSALAALAALPDLTGRVVVLGPPFEGADAVEAELARRGAEGILSIVPDDGFYHRLRVARGPTRFALPEPVGDVRNQGPLPSVVGGAEVLEALGLAGELRPGHAPERARSLDLEMSVRFGFSRAPALGYSVAGMVAGTDPTLAAQAVLYVAHYDHVSGGEPAGGDSIWNGFLDNAAGAAMLLEIARALARDPPARSVLFLFTTAEEQGLLGASWFLHRPPWPLERIRAALNLDGGAPPGDPEGWSLAGAAASEAGAVAAAALERLGYAVEERPIRADSDHWAFHQAGVAALFLHPGGRLRGLSEEESAARYARWFVAHTPHDEWSADFPFEGMAAYARAALAIGRALADAPLR